MDKRARRFLLFSLLLSIFVAFSLFVLFSTKNIHELSVFLQIGFIYVATVIMILNFIKKKPCNALALPIGFIIPPILLYWFESGQSGLFQYIFTMVITFFYTIPFLVLCFIIAIVYFVKCRKSKTKNGNSNE